jgi:hypothetical protein
MLDVELDDCAQRPCPEDGTDTSGSETCTQVAHTRDQDQELLGIWEGATD